MQKLKERLKEIGHEPNKKFGQNFLVSEYAIDKIIGEVRKSESGQIYEIGPGLGALTDHLIETGRPLKIIEFDKKLIDFWSPKIEGTEAEIFFCDALKYDWRDESVKQAHLVSNLPYQISSSLVIELSKIGAPFSNMTLMFQKEVADRLLAGPSTSAYGLLSVVSQVFWKMDRLVELSPRDFFPPPKVASTVLGFKPLQSPVGDERTRFIKFVKAAFSQRRKKMAKNLGLSKEDRANFIQILENIGKSETMRAEELAPHEFVEVFKTLHNLG